MSFHSFAMTEGKGNFDPRKAVKVVLCLGHSAKLGLKYSDHGPNWVDLELPWREDLVGDSDAEILASGPIVSLLDMASGLSIWTTHGVFAPIATLDLRVDYQRPARPRSAVIGHVECYRLTQSAAFVRGIAHDGDPADSVATMSGIFMSIQSDIRNV